MSSVVMNVLNLLGDRSEIQEEKGVRRDVADIMLRMPKTSQLDT